MNNQHFPQSEMSPHENLHFAIGMIAYAMAYADGAVHPEERVKFHNIVEAELRCKHESFNISDIIFKVMDKRPHDRESTYNMALHQLQTNSHYLSPELKETFLSVIRQVAKAYPPVTPEEKSLYERFEKDIAPLHGDPVYYEK